MIRCIAIDDEFLALEIIENYVAKCPFLELVATFSSPLEALPMLNGGECDLLLLDINMPDVNGLDLKSDQLYAILLSTIASVTLIRF